MYKKVSIVVAVYNVEKYLRRCLDSLINQTYQNIEIIMVDDFSTDSSLSICSEYARKDDRIKVIGKKENTGPSDTRNIGIMNSNGNYIMFVDSDDYVCDNFVEEMVKAIEEKNVDVVRCKGYIQREDGGFYVEDLHGHEGQKYKENDLIGFTKSLASYCVGHICAYVWAMIIRREKLNIEFYTSISEKEDLIFYIQLLLESAESIYFLDKALYHYCYNEKGITKSTDSCHKYIKGSVNCGRKIKNILSKNNLLDKKIEKNIDYTLIKDDIHKLYSLAHCPLFEIRKNLKTAFNNQELRKMVKNIDLSSLSFKAKILIILLKLRFYFLIAVYIKMENK